MPHKTEEAYLVSESPEVAVGKIPCGHAALMPFWPCKAVITAPIFLWCCTHLWLVLHDHYAGDCPGNLCPGRQRAGLSLLATGAGALLATFLVGSKGGKVSAMVFIVGGDKIFAIGYLTEQCGITGVFVINACIVFLTGLYIFLKRNRINAQYRLYKRQNGVA